MIETGLDRLLSDPDRYLPGNRVGLVVNQTSLTRDGGHAISRCHDHKTIDLKKIFAPEHGLHGVEQDMESVKDAIDPVSGLPVHSLYGSDSQSLSPNAGWLENLDVLVFDIQDVGSRYYTFIYTLANCMDVCAKAGVAMVVCDRPNPINGITVEGNLVGESWRSFVGQYPLPNRHGMTVGELARLFNGPYGIGCDLTVVSMAGWSRDMWYDETGLHWMAPSPNMPALSTATVYPGMCLIEGTILSEGRGTTLPFELIGAPWIDPHQLAGALEKENLPGIHFRPHYFKPKFQKWADEVCGGANLCVLDRDRFKPVLTGIAVIRTIANLYPDHFAWRSEPYEFVSDRPAIDLLYGNPDFRERYVKSGDSLPSLEALWVEELKEFESLRASCLIY